MTLEQQVYAQAATLCQAEDDDMQTALLELLCHSSVVSLQARLRPGLTPEDCLADFIASAALYALAAFSECADTADISQIQVGDLTLRRSEANPAAKCLRSQAELMMYPYTGSGFHFRGV